VFFDHNFRWKHIIQLTSMQFIFAVWES
jgi:hypothetical protein